MKDSGKQIGEKLFALLSSSQKKELAQFVCDYEAGDIPADVPGTTLFRGRYYKEVAYRRRTYRYKAHLSLDYGDDIEREAVLFTPTLQEIVERHYKYRKI